MLKTDVTDASMPAITAATRPRPAVSSFCLGTIINVESPLHLRDTTRKGNLRNVVHRVLVQSRIWQRAALASSQKVRGRAYLPRLQQMPSHKQVPAATQGSVISDVRGESAQEHWHLAMRRLRRDEFKNYMALNDHLRDKVHVKKPVKPQPEPARCEDCDRTFRTKAALKQHLKSVIHCPISNLPCLAGKLCGAKCKTHFRSPSAMVAHMESGSCSSGMDREKLNRLVLLQDRDNLITSSNGIAELSGWASLENEEDSPSHSGVMTPSTEPGDGAILTPSSSQLDLASLVGQRLAGTEYADSESSICTELAADAIYLCPLCPNSKRRFVGRTALEQHMHSPAHTPKVFHCPSLLFQAEFAGTKPSMKHFSTLSGLVAHIESDACRGGNSGLRTVMQYMEERLEAMGISFRFLGI
ncbi:hypothetical protein TgHK011_004645 [Trichoderma gracile]|nr:hypothetical protein TgHK011_004645 [Trichoderma gracile]